MLETEEGKVGKTSLRAKLTVLEQLETANEWQKREGCEWDYNSNPGSFASRHRVDEEMLFWVQTAREQTGIVFIRNSGT